MASESRLYTVENCVAVSSGTFSAAAGSAMPGLLRPSGVASGPGPVVRARSVGVRPVCSPVVTGVGVRARRRNLNKFGSVEPGYWTPSGRGQRLDGAVQVLREPAFSGQGGLAPAGAAGDQA